MDPLVPHMQAETGFELDDSAPPLRVSGFICLIFGVLSFLCLLGQPILVLPLIAIIFGVFACGDRVARRRSVPGPPW